MTREEFISYLESKKYSYHIEGESTIVDHDGYVWLGGLKILPDDIIFRNVGNVWLDLLTYLPSNIEFRNGGGVWLGSLTALPSVVKFRNEGSVWLGSISRLPIEDPDLIFQNTGYVFFDDNWPSMMEEFLESRWMGIELISEQ